MLLKHAGDDALILTQPSISEADDDDSDDMPSDLGIPESIPEMDEHSDDDDDDTDDECLLPAAKRAKSETHYPAEEIQFKSGHFNRTSSSSSSDDDSITSGLDFHNVNLTAAMQPTSQPQQSGGSFTSMVQGLVNRGMEHIVQRQIQGAISSAIGLEKPLLAAGDSSDESEFEILNHEELK